MTTISSFPSRAVTVFNFTEVEVEGEFIYSYSTEEEADLPLGESGYTDISTWIPRTRS